MCRSGHWYCGTNRNTSKDNSYLMNTEYNRKNNKKLEKIQTWGLQDYVYKACCSFK